MVSLSRRRIFYDNRGMPLKKHIMSMTTLIRGSRPPQIYSKDSLLNGRPARVNCLDILGQTYTVQGTAVKLLALEDEWYEDVRDPDALVHYLRQHRGFRTDLFTFWQRLPNLDPRYSFYKTFQSLAVLPVESYDGWWNKQIGKNTRNMVRKSQKAGIEIRECSYDDAFVHGMTAIFNESPVRQGRPFWHYGKDFPTVKRQFSRFLHREQLLGAFLDDAMVGFAMLGNAGAFCQVGQIIARIAHRDKAIPNALIAKAVELCERNKWQFLVYGYWTDDSLADFKRHSGFKETKTPRYFIPLSLKGKLWLHAGLYRGWKALLPPRVKARLRSVRAAWYFK
jgi:hypothetical protein